jgi:hypothetical protein
MLEVVRWFTGLNCDWLSHKAAFLFKNTHRYPKALVIRYTLVYLAIITFTRIKDSRSNLKIFKHLSVHLATLAYPMAPSPRKSF